MHRLSLCLEHRSDRLCLSIEIRVQALMHHVWWAFLAVSTTNPTYPVTICFEKPPKNHASEVEWSRPVRAQLSSRDRRCRYAWARSEWNEIICRRKHLNKQIRFLFIRNPSIADGAERPIVWAHAQMIVASP